MKFFFEVVLYFLTCQFIPYSVISVRLDIPFYNFLIKPISGIVEMDFSSSLLFFAFLLLSSALILLSLFSKSRKGRFIKAFSGSLLWAFLAMVVTGIGV